MEGGRGGGLVEEGRFCEDKEKDERLSPWQISFFNSFRTEIECAGTPGASPAKVESG